MKAQRQLRAPTRAGVMATLGPLVVPVLARLYQTDAPGLSHEFQTLVQAASVLIAGMLVAGASILRRHPPLGRVLVIAGALGFGVFGAAATAAFPLAALLVALVALGGAAWVVTVDINASTQAATSTGGGLLARSMRADGKRGVVARARGAGWAALASIVLVLAFELVSDALTHAAAIAPAIIALGFALQRLDVERHRRALAAVLTAVAVIVVWTWSSAGLSLLATCIVPATLLALLPAVEEDALRPSTGWHDAFLERPAPLLVFSFISAGLVGTVLLALPIASAGDPITVIDALFTAFSAVCVTGLIVLDTPVDFSFFGQGVIFALIQLGGLGIMTFSTAAFVLFGRRMSLRGEAVAVRLLGADDLSALGRALRRMLLITAVTEVAGAIALAFAFEATGDPWFVAMKRGVFTAVSAYCNAGFALQSDSLVPYASEPFVLLVVSVIIIVGSLGPAAVVAVPQWVRGRKVSVHVHLVLVMSVWLLVLPAILIGALEWSNTLADLGLGDRLMNAWFQSATTRTAGFNSVDFGAMNHATIVLVWALMFVGGSPGSTAGGVKTTTLAVLLLTIRAVARESSALTMRSRRIAPGVLMQALALVSALALMILLGIIVLRVTQRIETVPLIFEVISAACTVGLSMGATADLDGVGRVVVTLFMLFGRVGPLALIAITLPPPDVDPEEFPEAHVPIG